MNVPTISKRPIPRHPTLLHHGPKRVVCNFILEGRPATLSDPEIVASLSDHKSKCSALTLPSKKYALVHCMLPMSLYPTRNTVTWHPSQVEKFNIRDCTADHSVCFLWCTSMTLPHAMRILTDAWGFTEWWGVFAVWEKRFFNGAPRGTAEGLCSSSTELLLCAAKPGTPLRAVNPTSKQKLSSVLVANPHWYPPQEYRSIWKPGDTVPLSIRRRVIDYFRPVHSLEIGAPGLLGDIAHKCDLWGLAPPAYFASAT